MMKIKVEIEELERVDIIKKGSVVEGLEVLNLPSGTLVTVTKHTNNNAIGEILICTKDVIDSKKKKLVSMNEGLIWGDSIEDYTFLVLAIEEIKIKFIK